MTYDPKMLDAIFGENSIGTEPTARAQSSSCLFVRSQMQLGFDNAHAKGRRLNAQEALELFGYEALEQVAVDGRAHLFTTVAEPSRTLSARRAELRFSITTVAERAGVSRSDVEFAETLGNLNSIHVLERIAEALGLDERVLTVRPGARGDAELGLQLRTLEDTGIKSERKAAVLAEAAWVIGRQVHLRDRDGASETLRLFEGRSDDYAYKTYERGYRLAARTRAMLGLGELEPIHSIRSVAEDLLGLPMVEAPLGNAIAGATIVNNKARGIVLSSVLASTNKVLLRRTTIAHELGHALWDPDERLGRIKVDSETSISDAAAKEVDVVEMRARSFAIALLAPTVAIRRIHREEGSASKAVNRIIMEFGLSAPAAIFHLRNVCRLRSEELPAVRTPSTAHALWDERERRPDGGLEVGEVPLMRRGGFADRVVLTWRAGRISDDTASAWLRHPIRQVTRTTPDANPTYEKR